MWRSYAGSGTYLVIVKMNQPAKYLSPRSFRSKVICPDTQTDTNRADSGSPKAVGDDWRPELPGYASAWILHLRVSCRLSRSARAVVATWFLLAGVTMKGDQRLSVVVAIHLSSTLQSRQVKRRRMLIEFASRRRRQRAATVGDKMKFIRHRRCLQYTTMGNKTERRTLLSRKKTTNGIRTSSVALSAGNTQPACVFDCTHTIYRCCGPCDVLLTVVDVFESGMGSLPNMFVVRFWYWR